MWYVTYFLSHVQRFEKFYVALRHKWRSPWLKQRFLLPRNCWLTLKMHLHQPAYRKLSQIAVQKDADKNFIRDADALLQNFCLKISWKWHQHDFSVNQDTIHVILKIPYILSTLTQLLMSIRSERMHAMLKVSLVMCWINANAQQACTGLGKLGIEVLRSVWVLWSPYNSFSWHINGVGRLFSTEMGK